MKEHDSIDMTTEQVLIALLRAVLHGERFCEPLSFTAFRAVYKLAGKHDLAHLVYYAAEAGGVLPTPSDDAERVFLERAATMMTAAQYRYIKSDAELQHIGTVLEKADIDYMPMKGAVLRTLYPEPWMRTSCDIDILVRESDLNRAVEVLTADGFTTDGVRNYHDVLLRCDGVNLELHHNLLERMPKSDAVLETVWEHTANRGHYHLETPAFFLYHHIAHMAHHFIGGGCGIRTVMDLWLLLHNSQYAAADVMDLLQEGGLSVFGEQMCLLADCWFGDGEPDEQMRRVEQFVLHGGAFGSGEQRYASGAARHGKKGMAWRVMFMPYEDLKHLYPKLDGKPHLTWYYQWCRILTRLKQGRGGGAVDRIKKVGEQTDDAVKQMQAFLSSVGLYYGE